MYGKKTRNTPDGRRLGEPLAREQTRCTAAIRKAHWLPFIGGKIPYKYAMDGISNTFTIVPAAGQDDDSRINNLVSMLDGYVTKEGHHLNVNVLNRDTLLDAMEHPEKYPAYHSYPVMLLTSLN